MTLHSSSSDSGRRGLSAVQCTAGVVPRWPAADRLTVATFGNMTPRRQSKICAGGAGGIFLHLVLALLPVPVHELTDNLPLQTSL